MLDIVVTTPKKLARAAEEEARRCIEAGGGFYSRTFRIIPRRLDAGSRIYYVEHPYIRGYGTVSEIDNSEGYRAIMPANEWKWVRPIEMKGFRGWMYFDIPRNRMEIVGGWLDPKPGPEKYGRLQYVKKKGGSGFLSEPFDW